MSTHYAINGVVKMKTIKKIVKDSPELSIDSRKDKDICISDGDNYLWCYDSGTSGVDFVRYGGNNVEDILDIISEEIQLEIVSEHDYERYSEIMGFEDEEEDD